MVPPFEPFGSPWLYRGGFAVFAVFVLAALVVGTTRERAVLVAAALATVAATVVIDAGAVRPTGFGMQARYALPIAVLVPIVAGQVLAAHAETIPRLLGAMSAAAMALAIALLQVKAWRAGPHHFVALWTPPGGWEVWQAVTIAGAACVVLGIVTAAGRERDEVGVSP